MNNPGSRPVYLNLLKIRQPATALVSIGHRLSGLVLFLALPLFLFLFERSLQGPTAYVQVTELLHTPVATTAMLLMLWMLLLHFFAGIRFLLIDVDLGVGLRLARRSARAVLWAAPAATLILAVLSLW